MDLTVITTLYALSVLAGWLWLTYEAFEYMAGRRA